jgi:multiple sugar transport system permease protein
MFITMWWTVGFNMVLYVAAMQDIPDELYEAASIDGASRARMIFSVTIPMIKPTTGVIFLLQVIASFKLFAQPYMITSGGPGTATRPIIQYIYETAFKKNNLGYASTMSYALFIVLLIFTLIYQVLSGRKARAEK